MKRFVVFNVRRFFRFTPITVTLAFVFILGLVKFRTPILVKVGEFLVYQERPMKADVIVVLCGRDIPRALTVIDLYKSGYAKHIFKAEPIKLHDSGLLEKKGITLPDEFGLILKSSDVPLKDYHSIPIRDGGTYREAQAIKKFIITNNFKSLILVTSKYHSKRAYLALKDALEESNIRIISCPTEYGLFDVANWWQKRRKVIDLVLEYEKFLFYFVAGYVW